MVANLLLLFLLIGLPVCFADFSADFGDWLEYQFGADLRQLLERRDLGERGSFGGKISPDDAVDRQPVVFIHGAAQTAGDYPRLAADYFSSRYGYALRS